MKKYYVVGNGCGHKHRTRTGAERCARSWLRENQADIKQEAEEHGKTLRDYIDSIVNESTGDCMIVQITER